MLSLFEDAAELVSLAAFVAFIGLLARAAGTS